MDNIDRLFAGIIGAVITAFFGIFFLMAYGHGWITEEVALMTQYILAPIAVGFLIWGLWIPKERKKDITVQE
jgi:uncharacterized membrane protein